MKLRCWLLFCSKCIIFDSSENIGYKQNDYTGYGKTTDDLEVVICVYSCSDLSQVNC